MNRMASWACLGATTKEKMPFWCPFNREWDALDPLSQRLLRNAWPETPLGKRKRKRSGAASVYQHIRNVWCPAPEKVRSLNFERPDSKWLQPLDLDALVAKYEEFVSERGEAKSAPPLLSAVAPLLAPQGWMTEAMEMPEGDVFQVPSRAASSARWNFCPVGTNEEETTFAETLPQPDGLPWVFRRKVYRGKKMKAPLVMGAFDDDGVYLNFHGELDDDLPTAPNRIPPGTPVRFVVERVSEFKGYHWVEISRVLVHADWAFLGDY